MDSLYALKDLLCDQVDEIVAKNDISPTELDRVYKVVDVIKDIVTIDAMENADFDYSGDDMSYSRRGRYSSRRSYDNRMSGRRYSRDEEKDHMMHQIEELKRKVEQM